VELNRRKTIGKHRKTKGKNIKPWENHRKNTRNPGKMVIQARKIGISMRFMADSGDSWLIHDSEVGENGVADYSHFIGT
jgi:hypothetical protein